MYAPNLAVAAEQVVPNSVVGMAAGSVAIVEAAEVAGIVGVEEVAPEPAAVRLVGHPIPVVAAKAGGVAGAVTPAAGPILARVDDPNYSVPKAAASLQARRSQQPEQHAPGGHYAHAARCREQPAPPPPQ